MRSVNDSAARVIESEMDLVCVSRRGIPYHLPPFGLAPEVKGHCPCQLIISLDKTVCAPFCVMVGFRVCLPLNVCVGAQVVARCDSNLCSL